MIYFVATPIGNLEDMTLRAIRVLEEVDAIYCEDTRTSKKLLDHFDIKNKLFSYHKFNEQARVEEIIAKAREGQDLAVISDAGMPGISDPGAILVGALIENQVDYTVLPGPSAFTNALVLSGFDSTKFTFSGFFPSKESEKLKLVEELEANSHTNIFYETPHRVRKTLEFLRDHLPERKICLVREISKMYEDVKIFKAKDFESVDIVEKGEMVLLIDRDTDEKVVDDATIEEHLRDLISNGMTKKSAIKEVCKDLDVNKNKVYEISLRI